MSDEERIELAQASGSDRVAQLAMIAGGMRFLNPEAVLVVRDSPIEGIARLLWLKGGVFVLDGDLRQVVKREPPPVVTEKN